MTTRFGPCGQRTNETEIIAGLLKGMVAFAPLDEASGARGDVVGGYYLTEHNTVTTAPGKLTTAAQFTASNSERFTVSNRPHLRLTPGASFTVAAQVYFENVVNEVQGIVAKRDGSRSEWDMYLYENKSFVFTVYGSTSGNTFAQSNAAASPHAWHLVIGWWDDDEQTVNIQVDGGPIYSVAKTFSGSPSISDGLVSYGSYGDAFYNNGRMGQVAVWQRKLTDTERNFLHNSGVGVAWPLNLPTLAYAHTFAPSDLWENGYSTDLGGYYRSSAFAFAKLTTEATILAIDAYSTLYSTFPGFTQFNIRVNGADYTPLNVAKQGASRLATMLPAGNKTVEIVAGLQSRPSSTVLGTFLVGVAANAPITIETPTSSNRLLVYGDSISVGANATVPSRDGWVARLRNLRGNVMLDGYGFRALYDNASTAGGRSTFADFIQALGPSIIWMAIGTNDYGLNKWSAADFGSAYGSLLDSIHTRLPSATIYCQAPISRGTETANSFGDTLGNYRTQISNAASARASYCTYVNGAAWSITLDTDNLHPTSTGHSEYYAAVASVLGL